MPENNNPQRCTGNCMNCIAYQRQFCASQLAYSNMRQLEQLSNQVKVLTEKIEAMQNTDAVLFAPSESVPTPSTIPASSPA